MPELVKQNRKIPKKTILVIAEGLRDSNFLKYLESLYTHRDRVKLTIRNGMGGTADGLVLETINSHGSYDNRVTVLDNDKKTEEMEKAREQANINNIKLIEITPCIEFLLLSMLCDNPNDIPNKTGRCKLKYKKEFLKNIRTEENKDFFRLFPKKTINTKRKTNSKLNEIILLIEGTI